MLAVAALVAGALLADARARALDAGVLSASIGRPVETRAIVLEPVRERAVGPAVARVRLLDGSDGEQAVLASALGDRSAGDRGGAADACAAAVGPAAARSGCGGPVRLPAASPGAARTRQRLRVRRRGGAPRRRRGAAPAGGWPEVGDIVSVTGPGRAAGRLRRLPAPAQRPRGDRRDAGSSPPATRRGGVAGVLDGVRRRAEAGWRSGLAPPEAALLRGMVLGEDERLTEEVRDDFQRSGLAHILAVSAGRT